MGVVIELSASEMPRFLPPPRFSSPFAFPSLRWGRKRRLRCFNPLPPPLSASPRPRQPLPLPYPEAAAAGGPLHPLTVAPAPAVICSPEDPIQLTYPPEDKEEGESAPPPPPPPPPPLPLDLSAGAPAEAVEARMKDPLLGKPRWGGRCGREPVAAAGWRRRGKGKRRKVELWVSLSKDEIEEDFLWMTGAKPPRRSMRRSKVASDLQRIFPGSCLPSKITADRYRVSEPSDCRKD